ncbi:MAG: putative DNA binding domain-containing protein [Tannerellaceae bacterium]|jgi:ATP-dependent DNA helicase RecG|nr:putative DNA binding domain-containing protein [Tannerellaceae bacterium]
MDENDLKLIASRGENVFVEFSKCSTELTDSVFQSICSFLNKEGGALVVGIHDHGKIVGISDIFLDSMLNKFTYVMEKEITPSCSITPEVVTVNNRKLLYIKIPESPGVHRFKNKVFDRVGSEVIDITYNYGLVENLHLRKRRESSENIVCPFLNPSELDAAAFTTMRRIIAATNPSHPWLSLSNEALLHTEGFWKKDLVNNKEGYVLAAVLLFGKEVTIQNYCPINFRIEAIYRNIGYEQFTQPTPDYPESRYDDRDIIFSNLIETYPRLIKFVQRQLPEQTLGNGEQKIDILETILNEVLSNFLIHREYTYKNASRLLVFPDRLITENGSSPILYGPIPFSQLESKAKNPLIHKVFQTMGWSGTPGSGKETILKYAPLYDKACEIDTHDGEVFTFSMTFPGKRPAPPVQPPKPKPKAPAAPAQPREYVPVDPPEYAIKFLEVCPNMDISYIDKAVTVLEACIKPQPIQDVMRLVRQSNRTRFRQNIIRPLLEENLLSMRIPSKPSSPLQRYFTTEKGIALMKQYT